MAPIHSMSVTSNLLSLAKKMGGIRCVYDCGSRDALDGLKLMAELGCDELHAFECNPQAITLCRQNIEQSPYAGKAKVVPLAVAEKSGPLIFHPIDPEKTVTPHLDGNIGASSLYQANPNYPHERYVQQTIEVMATSLDDYCMNHTVPDLLWMDLQGAEARAIDGAQGILKRVKIIHVEISFRRMYLGQALFHDVHSRLTKQFRLAHLDIGRWPRLPWLYNLLNFGPWVGNAIYLNREYEDQSSHDRA